MGMVVRLAALVLSLMMLLTMGLVSADAGAAGDAVAPSAIFAADTPKAASTRKAPEVVSATTTTEYKGIALVDRAHILLEPKARHLPWLHGRPYALFRRAVASIYVRRQRPVHRRIPR